MIVAATGHRPNKLGGYSIEAYDRLFQKAKSWLELNQPTKIISGLALGWDQAWADAGFNLGIPFIAAIPFEGQENIWPLASRVVYRMPRSRAEQVVVVSEGEYASWKLQVRNQWMVNHCDKVVALWDGSNGGTANCVRYAEAMNKPIENLWPI